MNEILNQLSPLFIALFLATAMLSLGMDLKFGQITAALGNRRLMGAGLLSSVVIMPVLAVALTLLIPMDEALKLGFLLYALAAGVESGPKFVHMAKGNSAFAIGLLIVQISITVVCLPLAISLMVADVQIDRSMVLLKLLLVVALPLGAGLLLNARRPALAARFSPAIHRLSMTLLLLVLAHLFYANFATMLSIEASALIAAVLFFAIAFPIGYALGGPSRADRRALGIMSFARNAAISMMIATQVFPDQPRVLAMVVVLALMTFIVTAAITAWLGRTEP
jgi:BASS family bile acid:Na+ symporter